MKALALSLAALLLVGCGGGGSTMSTTASSGQPTIGESSGATTGATSSSGLSSTIPAPMQAVSPYEGLWRNASGEPLLIDASGNLWAEIPVPTCATSEAGAVSSAGTVSLLTWSDSTSSATPCPEHPTYGPDTLAFALELGGGGVTVNVSYNGESVPDIAIDAIPLPMQSESLIFDPAALSTRSIVGSSPTADGNLFIVQPGLSFTYDDSADGNANQSGCIISGTLKQTDVSVAIYTVSAQLENGCSLGEGELTTYAGTDVIALDVSGNLVGGITFTPTEASSMPTVGYLAIDLEGVSSPPPAQGAMWLYNSEWYEMNTPAGYTISNCGPYYCEAVTSNGGPSIIVPTAAANDTEPQCCGWMVDPMGSDGML